MHKTSMTLAAAGLFAAINAWAAVPTGAQPFQIVVPNLKSGLEFTVEGLYLQPSNDDLAYATVFQLSDEATLSNSNVHNVDPGYDFGFRVGIGYVFPNSGNDIQLSWTHFDNDDTDSLNTIGVNGESVITRNGHKLPDPDEGDVFSQSTADFDYDAIDLDMGQHLSIGTRLTTRLFAGVRFAQIKNNITDNYVSQIANPPPPPTSSPPAEEGQTLTLNYNSKFAGVGPLFGVDFSYHVMDCFGVVGRIDGTLLAGQIEASSNSTMITGSPPLTNQETLNTDNQTRIVPGFDAKLGFDYSWPIHNDAQRFTIETGYQITQYIDAIDRVSAQLSGGSLISQTTNIVTTTSSLGFNGPYLALNLKI